MSGKSFKGDLRAMFFTGRVDIWNALPRKMVESDTVALSKRHLGICLDMQSIEGNGPNAGNEISINGQNG